jgi:hypothetical protein
MARESTILLVLLHGNLVLSGLAMAATHLTIANLRSASIIFEDTILHIGSKDKDEKMPLHHGIHPYVNKHQSLVDC